MGYVNDLSGRLDKLGDAMDELEAGVDRLGAGIDRLKSSTDSLLKHALIWFVALAFALSIAAFVAVKEISQMAQISATIGHKAAERKSPALAPIDARSGETVKHGSIGEAGESGISSK